MQHIYLIWRCINFDNLVCDKIETKIQIKISLSICLQTFSETTYLNNTVLFFVVEKLKLPHNKILRLNFLKFMAKIDLALKH